MLKFAALTRFINCLQRSPSRRRRHRNRSSGALCAAVTQLESRVLLSVSVATTYQPLNLSYGGVIGGVTASSAFSGNVAGSGTLDFTSPTQGSSPFIPGSGGGIFAPAGNGFGTFSFFGFGGVTITNGALNATMIGNITASDGTHFSANIPVHGTFDISSYPFPVNAVYSDRSFGLSGNFSGNVTDTASNPTSITVDQVAFNPMTGLKFNVDVTGLHLTSQSMATPVGYVSIYAATGATPDAEFGAPVIDPKLVPIYWNTQTMSVSIDTSDLGAIPNKATNIVVVANLNNGIINSQAFGAVQIARNITITALTPPVSPIVGISTGTHTVATFSDADPFASINDFTATIAWGDGQTTQATAANGGITANPDGTFSVQGSYTYLAAGNGLTFSVSIADVSGVFQTTTTTINVAPAASQLAFQFTPATGTAGVALAPAVTVAVEDKFGNVVASDNSTVTLTLRTGTFANGSTTATAQAVNGVATFANLVINTTGIYSLTASDGTLTGATSNNLTINAAAPNKLIYQQVPASGIAGLALAPAVQVAVEDKFGNVVTGDGSTVTLTLSSGTFSTGKKSATASASGGVATFNNLTINVIGNYTLAASDGSLTGATSGNIAISNARNLVYLQAPPATGTAGVPLNPAVKVAIEDKFGNIDTSNNSTVTLTLNTGTFADGTTSVSVKAISGVATFASLTFNKSGSYKLTATDGILNPTTSFSFTINSASPTQLALLQGPPATATAGVAFNPSIKVAVEDQFGNVVATDSSTVTLTLSSGTFSTGSNTMNIAAKNGIALFDISIRTAGTYSLSASDGSLPGISSNNFSIVPAAASQLVYLQSPPATGTAGVALNPAVTIAVEDKFGNIVTTDSSMVTLGLNSGNFANGSATVAVQAINGVATFNNLTINKADSYKLVASDGALAAATSSSFAINAAAASQLAFIAEAPVTSVVGVVINPAVFVAVEDQYGNIVTSDNSTVTVSVANGPGGLTAASTTKITVKNGIANFSNLIFNHSGTYQLLAVDGQLTSATSGNIMIN